jgi:hypothetical protein
MTQSPPGIPRRWTVEVDGIRWLPRMIDKARMRQSGTLGAYLMGHSPVDRALLHRLGLTTDEFVAIANSAPDDAGVLAMLRARGFDEAGVRRWSASFPSLYRALIPVWDLDEGYVPSTPLTRAVAACMRAVERPVMDAFRLVSKAP